MIRSSEHYYKAGVRFAKAGEFTSAISELRRAVDEDPSNVDALYALGAALGDAGQQREAVNVYRAALSLDPANTLAAYNLASNLIDMGEYDEAIAWLTSLIQIDPKDDVAQNDIGIAYQNKGNLSAAEESFRKSIAIRDNGMARRNLAAILIDMERIDEAYAEVRSALRLQPRSARAHSLFGIVLELRGKLRSAVKEHRKALSIDPTEPCSLADLPWLLWDIGMKSKAISQYEQSLRQSPGDTNIAYNYGLSLVEKKSYRKAQRVLEKLTEKLPDEYNVWRQLALAYEHDGKFEKARECYLQAIDLFPDSSMLHDDLGILYDAMGRDEDSRRERGEANRLKK
jgi:tetratricopeptide (TPR) repeat protein